MSNNSDTISKLSDALSNLINAYETLQKEKENLEKENEGLKGNIKELESLNSDLENKLNEINSTNEKHGSNINSMLSKIETILKVGDKKKETTDDSNITQSFNQTREVHTTNNIDDEEEFITTPIVSSDAFLKPKAEAVKVDDIQLEKKSSDEKIDLNRMASLLNGFNK